LQCRALTWPSPMSSFNNAEKAWPDLTRLLYPSSVAVIGASSKPNSISGQPLAHMIAGRYEGKLFPVNPGRTEVQGLAAYNDVREIPGPIDAAVIAVPAIHVPEALEQCGEAGIPYAVVLTSGFMDLGNEVGAALEKKLRASIAKSGVRVVGPNCVGVMNLTNRAYLAFGGGVSDKSLKPGPMAIISQSGGFGQSMMTFANLHGVGCNYVVSCGNETDLQLFDFAHEFLDREEVKLLAIYMEASIDGARIRALGHHALRVNKPILILKVGNNASSRRAASSHTGRLTADYSLFRAAFREGGYIEVNDLDELADVARLVIAGKYPKGRRIGVLTGSGGWGVMMAEHCEKNGLVLPQISEASKEKLLKLSSPFASLGNPIDQMANYSEQHKMLEIILDDPAFDQYMVRSVAGPQVGEWTENFIKTSAKTDKPVIVLWASVPTRDAAIRESIETAGHLCSNYAGRAARAAARFTEFSIKRRRFDNPNHSGYSRLVPERSLELDNGRGALNEHQSKQCLAQYGIPVTREIVLDLAQIEALDECPILFPVAVKVVSCDIGHKTEAGAVKLGIKTLGDLKHQAKIVCSSALQYMPTAHIEGVAIQEMVSGVEVILGAVNDVNFGPYVMLGLGGVFAELLDDVTHRFSPVSVDDAMEMIAELRGGEILKGYRGAAPADTSALAEAIHKISWLIVDHSKKIAEIDINPLFVLPKGAGVVAADALIVRLREEH